MSFFWVRSPVCPGYNFLVRAPEKSVPGPESRNCVPDRDFGCLPGLPAVSGAKKSRKKVLKRFGGKEKSSTFAIPFGKRGVERGRGGTRMDMRRSLTRLEQKYK